MELNTLKNKNKIVKWIKDHVAVFTKWEKVPDEVYINEYNLNWKEKAKKHTILGIKFKWKF